MSRTPERLASEMTEREVVLLTLLAAIASGPHSHTYGTAAEKVEHAAEMAEAYFDKIEGRV